MRALGYPSKGGAGPLDRRVGAGRRLLRRAPVHECTRRKVVVEYASGVKTSRQIAREVGVDSSVVRNWSCSMLADDKELMMPHGTRQNKREAPKAGLV